MMRNYLLSIFLISFLLAPLTVQGQTSSDSSDGDSQVTKWIEGMQGALPAAFCKDGAFFRECFKVTEQECEKEAIRVTRICLESNKEDIKANLKKDGGAKWGRKVGGCAGGAYEVSLKDKKINTPRCNDPSVWIKK